MSQTICAFIRRREKIMFVYDRELRVVEPHLLGEDASGDLTLSAYQVEGKSGEGWRDFHVEKMRRIQPTGKTFTNARPGYNRRDTTIANIICRLGRPPKPNRPPKKPRARGRDRGRNTPVS